MNIHTMPPPEPTLEEKVEESLEAAVLALQELADTGELRGFAIVAITQSDGACPFYLSGRTIELAGAAAFLQAKILEEE